MKCIAPLLIITLLAACAAAYTVPVSPYRRARYDCERDMADSQLGGLAGYGLYRDRTRAHGWSK